MVMSNIDGLLVKFCVNEMHQKIPPDRMVNHQLAEPMNTQCTLISFALVCQQVHTFHSIVVC
jgi:hypothetical protein